MTITLDERTAAWARVHAARHKTSVSRLVGEMLRQRIPELREYDQAMRSYLARFAFRGDEVFSSISANTGLARSNAAGSPPHMMVSAPFSALAAASAARGEGWPSGRRCGTGNAVYGQLYRGFESHPLRHFWQE